MFLDRCRFVEYTPSSITALRFTPHTVKDTLLACGRANGNIEIWNPKNNWYMEKIIPGGDKFVLEDLTWAHQTTLSESDQELYDAEEINKALRELKNKPPRLFSATTTGLIIEWDLVTLKSKRIEHSNGGTVWCMSTNSLCTLLAIGCDDGVIRLFDIADDEFIPIKNFLGLPAKVLSLAWNLDNTFIVTGCSDGRIQIINASTGRVKETLTVERKRHEDTLVHAVIYLEGNTIVSGDSLGHVRFWDGEMGTMLQKYHTHSAPVLCLAANKKGTAVFSCGVDYKCNLFELIEPEHSKYPHTMQSASTPFWVSTGFRKCHEHEVKALAINERNDTLVSGGVDTDLILIPLEMFPDVYFRRISAFYRGLISLSKAQQLLMHRSSNGIKLWKLGKAAPPRPSEMKKVDVAVLPLVEQQEAVLEISLKSTYNLTSSALSEDGQWIAVTDVEEVKLFRIEKDPIGHMIVHKIKEFGRIYSQNSGKFAMGAHHLSFTPDNSKLIMVTVDSYVVVVGLNKWHQGRFDVLACFDNHATKMASTITTIAVSNDSRWLATGDLSNKIHIFDLRDFSHYTQVQKFKSLQNGLTFNPNSSILLITLISNEFYLFDLEKESLTDWSRSYSTKLPRKFVEIKDKIMGCTFNPGRPDSVLLWNANFICIVDINKEVGDPDQEIDVFLCKSLLHDKIREHHDIPSSHGAIKNILRDAVSRLNFKMFRKYQSLIFVDYVKEDSLVVVERPRSEIMKTLPPPFAWTKYGT
ncbi:6057_t:CDS:10 [Ambispora gerdemannii]|uniref:6057_t:CDS:1 n=1 Tax=Ambispora gerdemannii TaxID=144530 RepID=A0A9N9AEJ5_9GLOM|nr:6057_t:CDS:10 [Ambispora gerdemannii]